LGFFKGQSCSYLRVGVFKGYAFSFVTLWGKGTNEGIFFFVCYRLFDHLPEF